jgi:hypothetical protein
VKKKVRINISDLSIGQLLDLRKDLSIDKKVAGELLGRYSEEVGNNGEDNSRRSIQKTR